MIVRVNDSGTLKTFNILDKSVIADQFDSTQNYSIGDYVFYNNTMYRFTSNHSGAWSSSDVTAVTLTGELVANKDYVDDAIEGINIPTVDATLATQGAAADAKATGDAISQLTSDLGDKLDTPSVSGTSGQVLTSDGHGGQFWEDSLNGVDAIGDGTVTLVESGGDIIKTASTSTADLDVSDSSGNVLVRFENGHIKTKEFDSSEIIKTATTSTADLDVTDNSGNVIMRLEDGHIKTKNFNSSDLYPLSGKKWACIGDSLTEANVRTTLHYHDYISEMTGLNVVNLGHSGAGYYARYFDHTFRNQALGVPTDSDIVTIFGGGNDIGQLQLGDVTDTTASTLCGCVNITFDNLYTRLPTAYLGVITPTPWYQTTGSIDWTPSNPGNDLELFCEAIIEICRRRSIPCLDLYHMSNLRPQDSSFRSLAYSKDDGNGVHPDETGHKLIAARFMEFIRSIILC